MISNCYEQKYKKYKQKYLMNGGFICKLCDNNQQINKNFDINQITAETINNIIETIRQNNNEKTIQIEDDVIINEIGSGAYSRVYSVQIKNNKFALKIGKNENSLQNDKIIIDLINKSKINCRTITAKCHYNDNDKVIAIIMDQADGSFGSEKFIEHLQCIIQNNNYSGYLKYYKLILNITLYVAKYSNCLTKNGLYFVDLKPDNILYKCNNNDFNIFFTDLGGILKKNDTLYFTGTTYMPINYTNYSLETGKTVDIYHIKWNLLLFYLYFILYFTDDDGYKEIMQNFTSDYLSKNQQNLKNIYKLIDEKLITFESQIQSTNMEKYKLPPFIYSKFFLVSSMDHIISHITYIISAINVINNIIAKTK